ncbi:Gldg family protein [Kineobactrum salinum]|uniref:ABC transporter permease subunit n=1 Tax=Kineobactrum salinum TaxID=2708301 RepID=A0A6C0U7G5_9GAMM|nr:Gldg family protein [Kineobactrum salinum]QIB65434.1 ABC transporter permease subunit [Kineobactrum salinum]
MSTDSCSRRVAQKELRLFFGSPVAWLFLVVFAAVTLFLFFWVESWFARNIADVRPLFEWMPLLLILLSAALTMRMWSEERRSGTLEHVLTQPVGLWRFVLGKFRACFTLLLLALVTTLPLPVTVALMADLDWGPVAAGYLATALLGGAYLSIGLFVSARTDNPIVSLIGTVALCGLLYLLGSGLLTDFFTDRVAELLRLLGSGSRFQSITRGVLDLRDLVYYLSLIGAFLTLNVYTLERERWAREASTPRHRRWRLGVGLLLANLLLLNVWLQALPGLRLDVTEGRLYSISPPTREFLSRLEEPLLIRGYFSAKTHPLLAPLVPQLRDLIEEYAVAGGQRVRVEFIDPARHPALEQEAIERYNMNTTPLQVADRYQSSLVNAWFHVLVSYGDEFVTLGFTDLIDVRSNGQREAEVRLRNPEFDLTRAIRDVQQSYRLGGNLFQALDEPVELVAYVSQETMLPQLLRDYKQAITEQLQARVAQSGGKFSFRFRDPEAGDGELARELEQEWGFRPMIAALGDERQFYFYLTLSDQRQVVQLPTDNFDPGDFGAMLDAGLKRFARGLTRTVALAAPQVNEQMARFHMGAPTFVNLEQAITRDYSIRMEQLEDGQVDPDADILVVAAPQDLNQAALFAIDQFLMRGGTVVIASSPYSVELSGGEMRLLDYDSGLGDWLASHGLSIGASLVLDPQSAAFPAPVRRQVGDYEFRDVQMIDYPYFIDLRAPGLNPDHPVTASLPQLTMGWASPIEVEPSDGLRAVTLLRSSDRAWLSTGRDIMPQGDGAGRTTFLPEGDQGSQRLGVLLEGRFRSWFAGRKPPDQVQENRPGPRGVLEHSPGSARLLLFASNDFMDDQMLNAMVAAAGSQYLGPLELLSNTLEWALQDESLLQIRSRAHFNRTLPPMDRPAQQAIEAINYGLAITWLLLLALGFSLRKLARKRYYRKALAL